MRADAANSFYFYTLCLDVFVYLVHSLLTSILTNNLDKDGKTVIILSEKI